MPPIMAARVPEFISWADPGPSYNCLGLLLPCRWAEEVSLRGVAVARESRR
jgi:hypothetical protein